MMKKIVIFLSLFFPMYVSCLVVHTIDTGHPLKVTFSKDHQNRILLEDGFVKKVIAPQSTFSIQIERESGQVFVHSVRDAGKPVVLSVITSNGFVQDIEVTMEEKTSEVVVLKEPEPFSLDESCSTNAQKPCIKIISIIQDVRKGKIPKGFARRDIKEEEVKPEQSKNLYLIPQNAFESPYMMITQYKAFNQDQETIEIEESRLSEKDTVWIFVEQTTLKSGECTPVFICRRK